MSQPHLTSKVKKISHDTEETRQLILQVARQLFFENGYRAVTTRQIALACGLTQPALYHHFSDKQDLYVAVGLQQLQELRTLLERIIQREADLEQRLKQVVLCFLNNVKQDMPIMFHDIEHELNPENQAVFEKGFFECMLYPIVTIFEAGIQQGHLRQPAQGGVPAEMAAYLFLHTVSGFLGSNLGKFNSFVGSNENDIARFVVQLQMYGLPKAST